MAEAQEKISWYKKEIIRQIVGLAFEVSLISYLFFYLVDTLSVSFVSRFYSLNYHLVSVIILGILTVVWPAAKENLPEEETKVKIKDYVFIFLLAVVAGLIIWYKTKDLGRLSLIIAALSGLIIFFLSLLLMFDKDEDNETDN